MNSSSEQHPSVAGTPEDTSSSGKKQVKRCGTCREVKSSSDFYEIIHGHYVRRPQCIPCREKLEKHLSLFIKKRESKRKRLQKIFTRNSKVCVSCGKSKSLSEYYCCNQNLDGLKGQCKKCRADYTKKWHQNNPGYASEKRKEWLKANPDKARKADTKAKAKHRRKYRERERARQMVTRAREHGLVLDSCSWLGCTATENIEAAHDDYSKPHLIHSMCRKHHRMWDYCKGELPFDLPVIDISIYLKKLKRTKPTADEQQRVRVSP